MSETIRTALSDTEWVLDNLEILLHWLPSRACNLNYFSHYESFTYAEQLFGVLIDISAC